MSDLGACCHAFFLILHDDVGAHAGYYSLAAAKRVGPKGRVYAFEPDPMNRQLLERSKQRNSFPQLLISGQAVGAARGRRNFYLTNNSLCQGFFVHPFPGVEVVRTTKVEEVSLDEAIPLPVDLVKIDVEGAELDVLEGMTAIIKQSPALAVLVEWNPSCLRAAGRAPMELPNRLNALGFNQIKVLDDGTGRILELPPVVH
jgi:FkbM family methyltransferase